MLDHKVSGRYSTPISLAVQAQGFGRSEHFCLLAGRKDPVAYPPGHGALQSRLLPSSFRPPVMGYHEDQHDPGLSGEEDWKVTLYSDPTRSPQGTLPRQALPGSARLCLALPCPGLAWPALLSPGNLACILPH